MEASHYATIVDGCDARAMPYYGNVTGTKNASGQQSLITDPDETPEAASHRTLDKRVAR
jgi:hypothetical protein